MDVKTIGFEVNNGHVDAIHILSNEGDIYTAQAVIRGRIHTIEHDDSRQPMVFHSYVEAKRQFKGFKVPVALQPSLVYDEMVSTDTIAH